jgi:hypothetical protein
LWSLTHRKYRALVKVFEAEQYRLDLRSALIRLDLRNIWGVGDRHPDPWELEEILAAPGGQRKYRGSEKYIEEWLASRPEPTPGRIAEWQALQVKSAIAVAQRRWDGPEVFPLPLLLDDMPLPQEPASPVHHGAEHGGAKIHYAPLAQEK